MLIICNFGFPEIPGSIRLKIDEEIAFSVNFQKKAKICKKQQTSPETLKYEFGGVQRFANVVDLEKC